MNSIIALNLAAAMLACGAIAALLWGALLHWGNGPRMAPGAVGRRIYAVAQARMKAQAAAALPRNLRPDRDDAPGPGQRGNSQRGTAAKPSWLRQLRWPAARSLRALLAQSGSNMSLQTLLRWTCAFGLVALTLSAALRVPPPYVAVLVVIVLLMPVARLWLLRTRRLAAIEAQIPDALDLMARALLAGRSLSSAFRVVALEGEKPIADEFRVTFEEVNFGLPEGKALANLAARVALPDLRYFIVALLIQREAGGGLAQILASIAALVRTRMTLRRSVQVMSAEGRMSAWVLGSMPFLIAGGVSVLNPAALQVLWTDAAGRELAGSAIVCLAVGAVWMSRIASIRV